ncbi:MAG: hypothetical protein J6V30_01450 [Paludibacteraceae bacterium]|nr:hypothetical protein [Paludibacteraceae bacterium]
MKKVFLAIATLAMSVAVNAIGFDFTAPNPEIYDAAITSTVTNLDGMDIVETTAPAEGKLAGKYSINVTTASVEGSCYIGGIKFSYTNSAAGTTAFKTYGRYIQPNGKERIITIPTTAGDVVTITLSEDGTLDEIAGADLTTSTGVTHTLTATGSSIVITTVGNKPKFSAIIVGAATAVENASADAEEVKFFNVNGQEVAADAEGFVFGTDGSKKFNK